MCGYSENLQQILEIGQLFLLKLGTLYRFLLFLLFMHCLAKS